MQRVLSRGGGKVMGVGGAGTAGQRSHYRYRISSLTNQRNNIPSKTLVMGRITAFLN